jgi:citrate lyase beta subunit
MFFPKKSRECFEKMKLLQPDIVVLDLEDSVESQEKPGVRQLYLQALKDGMFPERNVFVRSSSLDCYAELIEDLRMFVGSGIAGFVLPKVEKSECVLETENLIAKIEKDKGLLDGSTKFIPIVETPLAHFHVNDIASCTKRNVGILAGSGDLTAEVVCDDHSSTYDAFFSNAVLAAKSNNIIPLCGVHDKIDDHIGFEKFCLKMKRSGFNGTVVLTPKQILMANYIFSLSPKEKEWTDDVLRREKWLKTIQKSVQESRQMIGPPHRIKAQNMIKTMTKIDKKPLKPIRGTFSVNGMCPDLSIGEVVPVPLEVQLDNSWTTLWNSSFINTDCTNQHSKQHVPFSLASTMAVAFSVSSLTYHARVHLAFRNIFQHRQLSSNDRVRAMFRIESISSKKGSDGNQYSIVYSTHWLINQHDEVVLQLEKVTMFQPDNCKLQLTGNQNTKSLVPQSSYLRGNLLNYPHETFLPCSPNQPLVPGKLLVHDQVKVMGHSETRMLCNLLHIVNPHHHNVIRYDAVDILVPGPFVMSAGISIAGSDIDQVIYQEVPLCINPNKVNMGDQLGTMTYVMDVREVDGKPQYEEVTLKHVVVKNLDMEVVVQTDLPMELFEGDEVMKPSKYEAMCANYCPLLLHKIACIIVRKIIRLKPGLSSSTKVPQELY